jgi:hypothetical protein
MRDPSQIKNLSKSSSCHGVLIASAEGMISRTRPEIVQEYMH